MRWQPLTLLVLSVAFLTSNALASNEKILHTFTAGDGSYPVAALIADPSAIFTAPHVTAVRTGKAPCMS